MSIIGRIICVIVVSEFFWCQQPLLAQDQTTQSVEFFEKQVRPILVKRCYECHSGEKTKGGLALDTKMGWQKGGDSGPAILPHKPDESPLIDAINYRTFEMPPKEKGGKLPDAEIKVLTDWVLMGAADPREAPLKLGGMTQEDATTWWAFQPLPALEANSTSAKIDQFVNRPLAERGITANPTADKRTLIRRATYDLTGLPPTSDEVDAFLADNDPDAFRHLVDRLLDSPQYGVKWGRFWLDIVRYADTAGENTDRPLPHAWRYRNWVIESFNRDLAFDEFVRLQLAGDILRNASPNEQRNEGLIATGYLAIARRFGHDIDKDMHLTYEDVIDNIGKNFLGMTTGCARCHDHKYDPMTTSDYYALYGIFDSSRFSFPGCEPKGQPRDLVPLITAAEVAELNSAWKEKVAKADAEKKQRLETTVSPERLKELAQASTKILSSAQVDEGASVPMLGTDGNTLASVSVKAGDVLQLTVLPNSNHGADSTQLDWTIEEVGGQSRCWSLSDVVNNFTESNPKQSHGDTTWFFLEATNGPRLMTDKKHEINGYKELKSWSIGELPSAFVNNSNQPITVWTTLPAKSVFVHPGPMQPVAVAWLCPMSGTVRISGHVADVHKAGLDGVSFQLDQITSAEFGAALASNGRIQSVPVTDPGPEPTYPVAYAVVEAEAKNSRIHQRGDNQLLGNEVPRRWLSVFGGEPVPIEAGSGRKQLGEWIAANPLTVRVIVNRIWQGHFGHGLVRTPNDFGSRGERPTHPELLDWLGSQFVASGYHMKTMHRLIMNSAAYQRNSVRRPGLLDADPENRLLTRFERRRLTAEEIRDSLLFASDSLDQSPGEAHPFPPEATWKFTQHTPFNATYDTNRRSAYMMVQRQRRHPFLALFDGADSNSSTPIRQTTTMPTQALYFLNDPFFHTQAETVSQNLLRQPENSDRLTLLFQKLFQRSPTETDRQQADQFFAAYPGESMEKWAAYARVLMAGNEFLHVD